MSVQKFVARAFAPIAMVLLGAIFVSAMATDAEARRRRNSQPREVEVQVTLERLIALDRGDAFSSEDFFARVTIDGQVFQSQRIRQTDAIIPNWRFAAIVPSGRVDVRIEVFDKDLAADDPIDINRVDPKRSLDFVVNTRSCRLEGFSSPYRCGQRVVRAGGERKKAEMTFFVDVVSAD
jgi:hypothetical protein